MFAKKEIETVIIDRTEEDYQNRLCPKCNSRKKHRVNIYTREIHDLGSLHVQKIIKFDSVTFKCLDCGSYYLVTIEEALKGYRYSIGVIEVAMELMIGSGLSAAKAADFLESLYNVKVAIDTLHKWFNTFKSEYLKHHKLVNLKNIKEYSGYITVDTTFSVFENNSKQKSNNKNKSKKKGLSLFLTPIGSGKYSCRLGKARIP
ncbi:MAG: hypothetical protein ACFFG0_38525 [Candidatus Thorarchaeota archaeon]